MVEQVSVGELGHAEDPCCSIGIEEVDNMDIEIPLQPLGVHFGSVHDFQDGGVANNFIE